MNLPLPDGALGFLGLSLAREAGVESEQVEKSFKAQKTFFGHYAFKGCPPYGEHAYGITDGLGDTNGRSAMPALEIVSFLVVIIPRLTVVVKSVGVT